MRLLDLSVGFVVIIVGIIVSLLFYTFYFSTSNGAIFVIAILIPLLFGIAGIGWILGGWVGVGAAFGELWFRFRAWLLAHLLYGDKEFLIDLMFIQHVLMTVYGIPYELVINDNKVIIKVPLSRDAGIRLMNYLNQYMSKLL
ncbi:hypothetical protein [Vulcanisaeta souniana]|nr:hypothetical protein [Vulcanisaeta souniana]